LTRSSVESLGVPKTNRRRTVLFVNDPQDVTVQPNAEAPKRTDLVLKKFYLLQSKVSSAAE